MPCGAVRSTVGRSAHGRRLPRSGASKLVRIPLVRGAAIGIVKGVERVGGSGLEPEGCCPPARSFTIGAVGSESVAVDIAVDADAEARARLDLARRRGIDRLVGTRLDHDHAIRRFLREVDVGGVPHVQRRIGRVDDRVRLTARVALQLTVEVLAVPSILLALSARKACPVSWTTRLQRMPPNQLALVLPPPIEVFFVVKLTSQLVAETGIAAARARRALLGTALPPSPWPCH